MQPAGQRAPSVSSSRRSVDPPAKRSGIGVVSVDEYSVGDNQGSGFVIEVRSSIASPVNGMSASKSEDVTLSDFEIVEPMGSTTSDIKKTTSSRAAEQQQQQRGTVSTPPPEESGATTDYQAFNEEIDSSNIPFSGRFMSWFGRGRTKATAVAADADVVSSPTNNSGKDSEIGTDFVAVGDENEDKQSPEGIMKDDDVPATTVPWYRTLCQRLEDGDDEEVVAHTPCQKFVALICSSYFILSAMFFFMAAGLTMGALHQYDLLSLINWNEQINVAFVGSSYLFVNDIPRLTETVAGGQIIQDSCLHSGGSLAALLMTGNGMYNRWQTSEAALTADNGYSGYATLYDYGACSVHQLISGKDQYIEYGNDNKAYYNDGNNACIMDENYLDYISAKYYKNPPSWNYVVLVDQSKRMASYSGRYDTLDALVSVYAPLLAKSGAVPVIVDTHAFWSSSTNMTGLADIPTFTKMIYEGLEDYVDALSAELPEEQTPIIAPVGMVYLTIWEEDFDVWKTLFLNDQMHASLAGSYLLAVTLYTTLFRHLPKREFAIPATMESLFANSRKLVGQGLSYPSRDEAMYLQNVVKRVVLKGHVPQSFTDAAGEEVTYDYSAEEEEADDDQR